MSKDITVKRTRGRPKADFTERDMDFIRAYTVSGDRGYAEMQCNMRSGEGLKVLNKAGIQTKIKEAFQTRATSEGLPTVFKALMEIVSDDKENAMARVSASKVILEIAFRQDADAAQKDLGSMTVEEINAQLRLLDKEESGKRRMSDEDVVGLLEDEDADVLDEFSEEFDADQD